MSPQKNTNLNSKQIKCPLSVVKALFFNESLKTGNFPRYFRIARIVPMYKEGDNTSVKNYHPISVIGWAVLDFFF